MQAKGALYELHMSKPIPHSIGQRPGTKYWVGVPIDPTNRSPLIATPEWYKKRFTDAYEYVYGKWNL